MYSNQPALPSVSLEFVRRLAAPPEAVYRAWTDARQFERWFAPRAFSVEHCAMDARVGGIIHFEHRAPGGFSAWVRGAFTELVPPPSRVALYFSFSDEKGSVVERPGFALSSTVIATFEPDGAGTLMRVRHEGLTIDQGESEGWKQTLERLESFLASA